MKKGIFLLVVTMLGAAREVGHAASIDRATITEVVNSVSVIEPSSKRATAARTQQLFTAPNVLRTGPESRAEMVAPDQTVTRVGQNTLFSFEPNSREIDLQKGSILFNSPSGNGGGTIRTPAASAAVLGTTLIVVTTQNGGFKVLLIEGTGRVKGAGGAVRTLRAGEMVYAMPGGKLSGILEFRLSQQVGASKLIRGFRSKLPSSAKIASAIEQQERDIGTGLAKPTNLLAGSTPTSAYQVDVARSAQIEQEQEEIPGLTPFQAAISSDATLTSATPDPARIFGPGFPEQSEFPTSTLPFAFGEPGSGDGPSPAVNPAQFFGENIHFDTPFIGLSGFGRNDVFQFAAINDIHFDGSTDFGKFPGQLQLFAGDEFKARPGSVIKAHAPQFVLLAFGSEFPKEGLGSNLFSEARNRKPLALSDIEIRNSGGDLRILGADVDLKGVRLGSAGVTEIKAPRSIKLSLAENPVSSFTLANGNSAPPGSNVITGRGGLLIEAGRELIAKDTGIAAPYIVIDANTRIRMNKVIVSDFSDGRTLSPPSSGGALAAAALAPSNSIPTTIIRARNLVDLTRVNFLSRDVLMQSRTISLSNVKFGGQSRVILESADGRLAPQPNTGQPAIPGLVNFINNVRYGNGNAAQFVIQNGSGSTPTGPGIVIRPRRN